VLYREVAMRITVITPVILIAVLIGGCSSTLRPRTSPQATHSANAPISRTATPETNTEPLLAYAQISSQDEIIMRAAAQVVVDSCMLKHGMTAQTIQQYATLRAEYYPAVTAVGQKLGLPPQSQFNAGPMGIDNLAIAREYGYYNPWNDVANSISYNSLPGGSNFPNNVFSNATTICVPQNTTSPFSRAFSNLPGSASLPDQATADPPAQLAQQARVIAMSDQAVTAAVNSWSACMANKGFRYSSPAGRTASPVAVYDTEATFSQHPSRAEIATAVADVECKSQTHLVAIYDRTLDATEEQLIQQNVAELTLYKRDLAVAVNVAENILSEPRYALLAGAARQLAAATAQQQS
jgi:hypothetical protein